MNKWLATLAGACATGLSLVLAFNMFNQAPLSNHCVSLPCSGTGCAAMVKCTPAAQDYLWFLLPLAVAVVCAAIITLRFKNGAKS